MKFDIGTTVYRNNAKQRNLKNLKNWFLYLAFLSLAIVSSYGAFLSFDVPFPAILIFLVFMACYSLCCINVKIKLTYIPALLLVRLLLFCINCVYVGASTETLIEQITITVCSIFVFLCGYNFLSGDKKALKTVLISFSFVTSIQIILSVIANHMQDKAGIVAGIGLSNYAACFLLLCVSYLLFVKTNILEKLVIVLDIIALLVTQSFGAYLALFVVVIVFLIKKINWYSRKVRRNVLALLILAVIAVIVFFHTSLGAGAWNKIKEKILYLLQGNWKNFGSSRGELFEFSWENIKRHLIFGTIENYNPAIAETSALSRWQGFRTHNLLLESLLLYGIVGTLINVAILFYIWSRGKKGLKAKSEQYAFIPCFVAILIHGMLEPAIFTLHFEIFLWLIIGIFMGGGRKPRKSAE